LRESREEANIDSSELLKLQTMSYIPTYYFKGSHLWGDDLFVIPEYCYGLKLLNNNIAISNEHMKYKWCSYKEAYSLLNYDSNRTALWELNQRLLNKGPRN
jgi:dATP pyrophosphohydrolase